MRIQKSITKPQTPSVNEPKKQPYRQNFKGVDSIVIGTMDAIERGGLFASFVTQDFLGTILPRPIAGLSRNKKENNGKVNTKFALKEATREFITGPSMFLIPMGILAVAKKHIGRALDIPTELTKGLGDIFKNTVDVSKLTDAKALKLDYYKNVFKNILSTTTNQPVEKIAKDAEKMAQQLLDMETQKNTPFFQHLFKNKCAENTVQHTTNSIMKSFTDLNKKHAVDASDDFFNAKIMTKTEGEEKIINSSFKKLLDHISDYANDVVEKTSKESSKGLKSNIKDFIENFNYKRINGRFALNLGMAAAVIGFLAMTPKLYNRSNENPGLIGLETPPTESAKEEGDVKNENK